MIRDYFRIATLNLRKRRLRSWLTMIGIFIGVAAVISLIGLGEGLRTAISSQFGFLGSDILSIQASGSDLAGPPGSGVVDALDNKLIDKLERLNGVKASYNRYIESGIIEFKDTQTMGILTTVPGGVDRKTFERLLNLDTEEGRLLDDRDTRKVLLGYNYAEEVVFGSENVFSKGIHTGDKISINDEQFEVVGVLEKSGNLMLDGAAFLNENVFLEIFGDDGTTDIIAVQVEDEKDIATTKESIEKLLRRERDVKKGEEDFSVESPQKILESLNSTLFAVQLFVYIIASISIVVGGIGIMNTMYTAVLERTKEIGIMKAIGATNTTIFILFFIESGFLGMIGGLIGIIIGMVLAYGLAAIGKLALGSELIQVYIPLYLILGALTGSFMLGTIFGVIPAMQASKLQPVDALRSK